MLLLLNGVGDRVEIFAVVKANAMATAVRFTYALKAGANPPAVHGQVRLWNAQGRITRRSVDGVYARKMPSAFPWIPTPSLMTIESPGAFFPGRLPRGDRAGACQSRYRHEPFGLLPEEVMVLYSLPVPDFYRGLFTIFLRNRRSETYAAIGGFNEVLASS